MLGEEVEFAEESVEGVWQLTTLGDSDILDGLSDTQFLLKIQRINQQLID